MFFYDGQFATIELDNDDCEIYRIQDLPYIKDFDSLDFYPMLRKEPLARNWSERTAVFQMFGDVVSEPEYLRWSVAFRINLN